MKHQWQWLIISLMVVVIISLGVLWIHLRSSHNMSATTLESYISSLKSSENPSDEFIRTQAQRLSVMVIGDDGAEQHQFAQELVHTYLKSQGVDFLLVYNTGGFGGTTMADDPEWPSVLQGIQGELQRMGYSAKIIEYHRSDSSFKGYVGEVVQIMNGYRGKSPLLAAQVSFVTKYNPQVRFIITGRSNGAVFSSAVMELLRKNDRAYSIQAGSSFWYKGSETPRTLMIDNNGIMPDSFSRGDFWTIIKANVGRLPTTSPPEEGSMQILRWYIELPGHTYTWEHPGVRSQVRDFLHY